MKIHLQSKLHEKKKNSVFATTLKRRGEIQEDSTVSLYFLPPGLWKGPAPQSQASLQPHLEGSGSALPRCLSTLPLPLMEPPAVLVCMWGFCCKFEMLSTFLLSQHPHIRAVLLAQASWCSAGPSTVSPSCLPLSVSLILLGVFSTPDLPVGPHSQPLTCIIEPNSLVLLPCGQQPLFLWLMLCCGSHILECEVKWALESITTNKASGGDGIPVQLFHILKDDAVKVLHSICQQIWKTQQRPQDWKKSVFIPIPKKGNAKECSNYLTIALISHAS